MDEVARHDGDGFIAIPIITFFITWFFIVSLF